MLGLGLQGLFWHADTVPHTRSATAKEKPALYELQAEHWSRVAKEQNFTDAHELEL